METKTQITVSTTVKVPVAKAWEVWSTPHHIMKWNNASDDWHTPAATNDLRTGGKFSATMAAKDGSMSFEFGGVYSNVETHKVIEYSMSDGRFVSVQFTDLGKETKVVETFDAESQNPVEMQRDGWQAIMNNFKKYAESLAVMSKLRFEILIKAPVDKVYKLMLEDASYRIWTAPFNPGSYFKGSWKKGTKILFLGPDGKGNEGGMVSEIAENIPNKFVSIHHLGILKDGKEILNGPEVEGWGDALENYTFAPKGDSTLLNIEVDTNEEYKAMFEGMWPKALQVLKEICEK